MKEHPLYAATALPAPDAPLTLLGGLTPQQFMRRHWQKKPLLVRQAFPGVTAPADRETLFALAGDTAVESRLVRRQRGRWSLAHGPFDALPSPRTKDWTVLLQGLNLHLPAADALLSQFRFVPDARLDDLMISYATDGGGVGPHFDSYDVFLIQVHGQRRWQIAEQTDRTLRADMPVKILAHFEPEQEWVLEPGDLLYLPPHWAHDGIAVGECMTCSVGFRTPAWTELVSGFLEYLAEAIAHGDALPAHLSGCYADPQQPATTTPAQLPAGIVDALTKRLDKLRWDQQDVRDFLGRYLSEPKPSVVFAPPAKPLSSAAFARKAAQTGVAIDAKTRLLVDGADLHLNGESFVMPARSKARLTKLANQRGLNGKDLQPLLADADVAESLYDWYCAGWLQLIG